jgi:hypothetical protein
MLPVIVPGFGSGVSEGAMVSVIVDVGAVVIVIVGVNDGVAVKANSIVGVWVGCSMVRVAEGVCSTDWVKAVKVNATTVATVSGGVASGVTEPGRLHAHNTEIKSIAIILIRNFFIGNLLNSISIIHTSGKMKWDIHDHTLQSMLAAMIKQSSLDQPGSLVV